MITADNLNDIIEFDSPFTVFPGNNIIQPIDVYAPTVWHDSNFDYVVDGVNPIDSQWQPFSGGYTGQYGYNGPTMHASEQLSGALAEDILSSPGTYVVTTVEVQCDIEDADCYGGDSEYRRDSGCDCEPAGWIVLRLKD